MSIRALLLRQPITEFLDKCNNPTLQELELTDNEWKQIHYIIVILFPFWQYTQSLSISHGTIIHRAWPIYKRLFQHLETRYQEAERERYWKEPLQVALQAAKAKLSNYIIHRLIMSLVFTMQFITPGSNSTHKCFPRG